MLGSLIFVSIKAINSENLTNPNFELAPIKLEEVVQTLSVITTGGGITRG
jgi:hypothetical protein